MYNRVTIQLYWVKKAATTTAAKIPVFFSILLCCLVFVACVELREDAGRPDREGHD